MSNQFSRKVDRLMVGHGEEAKAKITGEFGSAGQKTKVDRLMVAG